MIKMCLLALLILIGKGLAVGITMYFGMKYIGENYGNTKTYKTIRSRTIQ